VILLALYFIFRPNKHNGQEQHKQLQPEVDLYTDDFLESVQDQPELDSEDSYDFYEEDVDDELWREDDGHHRSQIAKFIPESEPAGAPANYEPYTQRQIPHPQAPRRSSIPAITTAVAATPGSRVDDSRVAQQQTVEHDSYSPRTISEGSIEYRVDDGADDSAGDFSGDFSEESDDVMLDKSIHELTQSIEDVPIYRRDSQDSTSSSMSQPTPYRDSIESLPSEVKSERLPVRTVDEARLQSPRPTALLDTYTVHYHMGEPDYEDCYEIETEDGNHIGIVGMGIDGLGGILDQKPEQVIVLDVWLSDTMSEETLTQLLLSKYAQQYGAGDTSRTERPLMPAQMGLHFQLKSENMLLDCEVAEVHFVENHGPSGLFQSLTLKMEVYQNDD